MPPARHDRTPWSLPLFPLRTVLYPGGVLPLKVFEQRYIEMTKACLREARPFGVCLIQKGDEVASGDGILPEIATVGTLAHIASVDMPRLGILHLSTTGGARFEVRGHEADAQGMIIGTVTTIEDEASEPLAPGFAPLRRLVELVAAKLDAASFPADTHFDDATWVGYRLAEILPLPLSIKQRLLEINDANLRLVTLKQFLERQHVLQAV